MSPGSAPTAAHFLQVPELLESPPNTAIISALLESGYAVDVFAPGMERGRAYGGAVRTAPAEHSWRWIWRHAWRPQWRSYSCFSGTSEDALALVGILAALHRRPCFVLADEIRSGSYAGNRGERWKRLCRRTNRRARFNIVNDASRIPLLRDYAGLAATAPIVVYPGCFHQPPQPAPQHRAQLRRQWGFGPEALVLAASGAFSLSVGADWLIESLNADSGLHAVVQPLACDPLALFLLQQFGQNGRLFLEQRRLGWREAWCSAVGFDIGLAIYRSPAPQFQAMGISSNRLCMFLAMGVPVIASRQPSFAFLERYGCGVMVSDGDEFRQAIAHIRDNLVAMRAACRRCFEDYIMPADRYPTLVRAIAGLPRSPRP